MLAIDIHVDKKDSVFSFSTVNEWIRAFRCSCKIVENAVRSGYSKSASRPEIIVKFHAIFSQVLRLKISETAEDVNYSKAQ